MFYLSLSQTGLENPNPPDYPYKQFVNPNPLFSLYWDSFRSFKAMNGSNQFKTQTPAGAMFCVLLVGKHRKQLCISLVLHLCVLFNDDMYISIR